MSGISGLNRSSPSSSSSSSLSPSGGLVAIVAAMPEEVAALRARLVELEARRIGHRTVRIGRLEGVAVALLVTGDGERNARQGLADLLGQSAELRIERLIVVGTAGALSPGLSPADLVVATHVVREPEAASDRGADRDQIPVTGVAAAGPAWVASAARLLGARPAVVVTARRIADSPLEKQRLWRVAAAANPARSSDGDAQAEVVLPTAVVDLESAIYAEVARAAGIAWLVVRAVSDTASEGLPELLNRSRDSGGAVRRTQIVRGLLGDPRAIPRLLALRGRVVRCAEALAEALREGVLRGAPAVPETAPMPTPMPATTGRGVGMVFGTQKGSREGP
jgi:adenosylhomocysteine nucleosidase